MSETLGTRFDHDAGDVDLRYAEGRRISPSAMAMWLEAIERHVPRSEVKTIIDLGCGTGRFSAALCRRFAARVARRAMSDLASISDEEFRYGREQLRRYCAAAPRDEEIAVDVDLFVFRRALE